jgi:hypothetical protein
MVRAHDGQDRGQGPGTAGGGTEAAGRLYIQAFHVSDVEARQEAHWVESIKIGPAAEPEELGKWTG